MKQRKRASASVAVVTAAAVALGIMAFSHPGFTTTDVDMHDGGVWVTKLESSELGHLNYQAQELDAGLTVPSESFDVVQDDGTVIMVDHTNISLRPIDTGQVSLVGDIPMPGIVDVTLRGGTITIVDPIDGRLWALPVSTLAGFRYEESDPLAVLGPGGAATADEEGNVHAVSSEHATAYTWEATDGVFAAPTEQQRAELGVADDLQITAVGTEPAALDAANGVLLLPASVIDVPETAVLQQSGIASESVVLATGSELIRQPLAGGDARAEEYASGGDAVAPVQLATCVHAAWPGDSRVIRACDDESANLDEVVDAEMSGDVLFREHRGVVALNDVVSGVSWLMTDELVMVDNWADLIPPTSDEETEEQDDESMDDSVDHIAPDPSEENNPPVAHDDTIFGARTGRSTLVPVLHNDSDPDGDILTVSLVGDAPAGVRISPVRNSSQFQVEVPADFSANAINFRYRVDDGRGGTDEASVTLRIRDDSQNAAPETLRDQGFEVEQRAQYEHAALDNWFDPDGDDVFLVDAFSDSGDTVRFNPNGRIIYTATGESGPTTMTIVVSDGIEERESTIDVQVRERGTSTPMANADYASVNEGETTSLKPLANDFLPAGENARLASATPRGDLTIDLDRSTNTLHVTGGSLGTHYIDYTVAAGPSQAQGHIRVDVTEPIEDAVPVAVRDVALLPMGGEALLDLTENDVDPAGGVLVVQSVDTGGVPLSVQLVHRHMLRIEDQHGLTDRATLTYQVSNGTETATGEIVVIPVEPPDKPRSPVAVDDTGTLREGDFTSIDVTANDFSPDNLPFSLDPELVESSLLPEEGYVFVDGDQIRLHVVGGPSFVDVIYQISDNRENTATASVRVEIERRDLETNNPPHAQDVTSRVLAGNTVRVPIPLNGIDPDGDGVTLVGWETAPGKGRIVEIGPDYFDFEAFSGDSGTTTFQYRVRDRWGAESVSSVTVGIAQPSAVNQPPQAMLDSVHVRPDRAVAVSVLDNDTDPDGDELTLVSVNTEDAPRVFDDLRLGSETPTVNFTAPSEPGDYMLEYTIRDVRGASAIGAILVQVDAEAPLIPPQAVDDVVALDDLTAGEPFVVPVLENDRDVDGDPADLALDVLLGEGTVVDDGIQIMPGEEFQVITYRATDQDGGAGEAFIFVPAIGERLPYVASDTVLYIGSGQLLEIPLSRVVELPNGGTARITTADAVSATNDNGDSLVIDEHTLAYTSAPSYVGDAAINFEVTDGAGPDDPDALTARLTVPIVVTPSSEVDPEFHGAVLQVQPGEAATEYDLKEATRDPDPGDLENMKFRMDGGEAEGIDATIDDQTFVATAETDTPPGTRGSYQILIEDPAGNVVPGTVTVEVVASTRPLPQAIADSAETDQGVEVTVNVLQNDFNPFQNIGESLNVRDVQVLRGEAIGAPSTDGTNVTVTPGADFSGMLTLQYTIEDATQNEARTAVGNVEISVRGRPDAPLRPNVNAIGDAQVTLSWTAPSANGAPITGYLVEWDGGAQECGSTSCTVTGLTNDTVYNFRIVAVNDVGESDPSQASIDARPDVRPEQPNAPSAERGDQELDISWEQPENRGSSIEFYILQISPPAPDGTTQQRVESTNFTWKNLRNGTGYIFSVQAHNNADEPSEWSPESRERVPAGPPTAPGQVSASPSQIGGSVNQVVVSWGVSDGNGVSVDTYTITPYRGGTALNEQRRTIPATGGSETASTTFESLPVSEQPYTFRVYATNDVSDGQASTSDPIRLVNPPGAPTATHVSDSDGYSTINIQAGALNGYRESELSYQYRVGSGSWQSASAGNQRVNASNGAHTVQVRAVGTADDASTESDPSSVGIHPYGPIGRPSASATAGVGSVEVSWDAPSANGHPVSVRVNINGGGWESVGNRGSRTVNASNGQRVTIEVEASTGKQNNNGNGAQTTTNDAAARGLQPSITLTRGPVYAQGSCSGNNGENCRYFELNWDEFPSGTYNFQCFNTGDGTGGDTSFQTGQVVINSASGSTTTGTTRPDGTNHLCYSGFSGDAWMVVSGNGVNVETPVRRWPG